MLENTCSEEQIIVSSGLCESVCKCIKDFRQFFSCTCARPHVESEVSHNRTAVFVAVAVSTARLVTVEPSAGCRRVEVMFKNIM